MLYSSSFSEFPESQSAMDQLFSDLQSADTALHRQELVSRALKAGVDQNEIREMLDYIESFGNPGKPRGRANFRKLSRKDGSVGGWTSFVSGLICRYL